MKPKAEQAPTPTVIQSPWAAFRHRAYTVVWTATVVSNIGTWMYSSSSAWLMTELDANPSIVSLVQAATTLPMFALALPAGTLADMVDKRRFLIVGEISITTLSAIFALLVALHRVTPVVLLLFAFLIGVASALVAPAWQAVVPSLVPKEKLRPAVTANSVGVNISRAVGPALGGLMTTGFGLAAPFWVNAVSNLGVIGALLWWTPPKNKASQLPAERFMGAIRTGLRHARHNPHLKATLARAVGFFLFASAYWALLPLVARNQIVGGATLYGVLLGSIGSGAVGGAFLIHRLVAKFGPNRVVLMGEIGTAVAIVLFGLAHEPVTAVAAGILAGACWIAVLSSLNISTQVALPEWIRARGLALYVSAFSGTMAFGSVLWGRVASWTGLSNAHYIAATGALLVIPLTRRWKLHTGAKVDLTPSMHWPTPVVSDELEPDVGPVLVTVEYHVDSGNRGEFLAVLHRVGHERRRDGAYAWGVFEDVAVPGRFVETFLVESWLEHLRQHERVTNADRKLEERVRSLARQPPKVTHLIAARADDG